MKLKYLILLSISGLIIALDQITKMHVHANFYLGESIPVIEGFFNLTYVRNPGAAFGFLARSHPEFREWFFLLIPPIALIIIFGVLRTVSDKDKPQILGLSLVFGGAIGNYIDRLRFSYVIDFLDFYYGKFVWPAFNVADISIVTGVCLLILLTILESKRTKAKA